MCLVPVGAVLPDEDTRSGDRDGECDAEQDTPRTSAHRNSHQPIPDEANHAHPRCGEGQRGGEHEQQHQREQ